MALSTHSFSDRNTNQEPGVAFQDEIKTFSWIQSYFPYGDSNRSAFTQPRITTMCMTAWNENSYTFQSQQAQHQMAPIVAMGFENNFQNTYTAFQSNGMQAQQLMTTTGMAGFWNNHFQRSVSHQSEYAQELIAPLGNSEWKSTFWQTFHQSGNGLHAQQQMAQNQHGVVNNYP